ncbi:hypothetical protein FACS1894121_0480 [Bacteroidia bacterium]|nr:hypothetical protein FACS1894121_0480 [Bacteroidia bacterium]
MLKCTNDDVTKGMETLERTSKINKALASADPRNMEVEDEDRGIFDWNFADIIATIFMVLGALIKVIIMFVRGVLLIVLRFSLPLVVAMSFVPTFEGAIKEWWESYKTLALWLIPLTIIELVSTTSWVIAQTATTWDGSSMINACVALVCGILYMLAPQITAMMFGGSPAMAGISQPIMSAGAILGGLGHASLGSIKRGGKVVSKARKGAKKSEKGAENDKGAKKPEKPVA